VGDGRCSPPVAFARGAGPAGRPHRRLGHGRFRGARRTDTALARLDKVTNAPDAIVFASQVQDFHPDWSRLAARPQVAQLAARDPFSAIYGEGRRVLFASGGDGWLTQIDKPVVLAGRMFNPKADDEMVVDVPPLSAAVVVLAVAVVLLASNVIAVGPARSVARAKPAETLGSE
jgi:hypothetical protein